MISVNGEVNEAYEWFTNAINKYKLAIKELRTTRSEVYNTYDYEENINNTLVENVKIKKAREKVKNYEEKLYRVSGIFNNIVNTKYKLDKMNNQEMNDSIDDEE